MARVEHSNLRALTQINASYLVVVLLLAAAVVWGVFVYVTQQLATGLGVTGMNLGARWGVYIVNFVFFIGLSAGGIIVASLVYAVGIERFKPVGRIAEIVAIVSLIMAIIFILLDLGRPERMFYLFLYGQLGSPLIWDVIIVTLYLIMSLTLGYFSTRADLVRCMEVFPSRRGLYRLLALGYTDVSPRSLERDGRILRVFAIMAIPGAVALHSITAWILGVVKAQPGWHTALLAPLFVTSAVASGLALVIVAATLSRVLLRLEIRREVILDLGKVLALLLPFLAYLLFSELLTVGYAAEIAPATVLKEITSGSYAPVLWVLVVAGLLVAPFLLGFPQALSRLPERRAALFRALPALVTAGAAVVLVGAVMVLGRAIVGAWAPRVLAVEVTPSPVFLGQGAAALAALLVAGALAYPRRGPLAMVGVASALVVIAVFAERNILVLPSLLKPLLPDLPGLYQPTWVELSLMVGVYALGALAFFLVGKVIPLVELRESQEEATW